MTRSNSDASLPPSSRLFEGTLTLIDLVASVLIGLLVSIAVMEPFILAFSVFIESFNWEALRVYVYIFLAFGGVLYSVPVLARLGRALHVVR